MAYLTLVENASSYLPHTKHLDKKWKVLVPSFQDHLLVLPMEERVVTSKVMPLNWTFSALLAAVDIPELLVTIRGFLNSCTITDANKTP
jgi:hypothetical protein